MEAKCPEFHHQRQPLAPAKHKRLSPATFLSAFPRTPIEGMRQWRNPNPNKLEPPLLSGLPMEFCSWQASKHDDINDEELPNIEVQ
jgi:hypothetical protein